MGRHYTRRGVLGAVASDGTRGRHSLAGAVRATMDLAEKLFCSRGSCPFGEKWAWVIFGAKYCHGKQTGQAYGQKRGIHIRAAAFVGYTNLECAFDTGRHYALHVTMMAGIWSVAAPLGLRRHFRFSACDFGPEHCFHTTNDEILGESVMRKGVVVWVSDFCKRLQSRCSRSRWPICSVIVQWEVL